MGHFAKALAWLVAIELLCIGALACIAVNYRNDPIGDGILSIPTALVFALASLTGFVVVLVYLARILYQKTAQDTLTTVLAMMAMAAFGYTAYTAYLLFTHGR